MLLLAFRAVEGRAARLHDSPDGGIALHAGLPLPAIDLVTTSEVTEGARDIGKVADAASTRINRLDDHVVGGCCDSLDSLSDSRLAGHTGCRPAW